MENESLKKLIIEYKREIKAGNFIHLMDYIAVSVYYEFIRTSDYNLNNYYFDDLTLYSIINSHLYNKIEEIKVKMGRFERKFQLRMEGYGDSSKGSGIGFEDTRASRLWIDLLELYGFVHEGDTLKLSDYRLIDYVSDPRLEKLLPMRKDDENKLIDYETSINEKILNSIKEKYINEDNELEAEIIPFTRSRNKY